MAKDSKRVYQIKVTLNSIRPPVWRRILVPSHVTLFELHQILQVAMGWHNAHLHQFLIDGQYYGDPQADAWDDLRIHPETDYRLDQVVTTAGARFRYEYDFGDGWQHVLSVEKILPPQPDAPAPRCLAGKRACPPEDVGGVWGYADFLEAIADPKHAEHDHYLRWVGGAFDPEAFDLEAANARLRRMGQAQGRRGSRDDRLSQEPQALSADELAVAEQLPLRRDMFTLLTYLRDNRITGTSATGNLPLKAVREICARLVNPPILERKYGSKVFRVRTETEVRPLLLLHVIAVAAGWASGGPGRRWRLTPAGQAFLDAPAMDQVWRMFASWWALANWEIISPFLGTGFLPDDFDELALERLLALPAEEPAHFEPFADRLIADAGLVWQVPDPDFARDMLHGIIENVIVTPLNDLGVLETAYMPHRILGPEYSEPVTLRLTPLGRAMLKTIRNVMEMARR